MKRLAPLLVLLVACSLPPVQPNSRTANQPLMSPNLVVEPPSLLRSPSLEEEIPAVIGGSATWYCGGGSPCTRGHGPGELIAAIDPSTGIRKGTHLRVHHEGRSVDVLVVDVCACSGARIIDLSRLAFSRLADPSRGVIDVAIEEVRGVTVRGLPTPPATDLELP